MGEAERRVFENYKAGNNAGEVVVEEQIDVLEFLDDDLLARAQDFI